MSAEHLLSAHKKLSIVIQQWMKLAGIWKLHICKNVQVVVFKWQKLFHEAALYA